LGASRGFLSRVTIRTYVWVVTDYLLSEHSSALCRVGPGFEEPLDDDDVRNSYSRL
ncbi:hypothetical protein HAX54_029064, partial [Datura stramonium]|nr:hypothetical protein [Datura stramonium]